jgi:hypothetical protein
MTLRELQEIGREAGLSPERVAEAAHSLAIRRNVQPRRTFLGVPISVGRTVELPRALNDREWEMLVGELRQIFGARGRVESLGSLRSWTNGNLHVYAEPTEAGHRLRMGTLKSDGVALTLAGLGGAGFTAVMASGLASWSDTTGVVFIGLMSAVALGMSFGRLPRWARQREEQMEQIARRALALMDADQTDPPIAR